MIPCHLMPIVAGIEIIFCNHKNAGAKAGNASEAFNRVSMDCADDILAGA